MKIAKPLLGSAAVLSALATVAACSVNSANSSSTTSPVAAVVSTPAAAADNAGSSAGSAASTGNAAWAGASTVSGSIALGPYCDSTCAAALKLTTAPASVTCKAAFLDDATSFPYGAAQLALSQKYAKQYFPNMKLTVLNGNNDPATQSSQLDTVVSQGFKTVILDPVVSDALVPATKRAVAAGVKIITIDRTVNTPVVSSIKAPDVPLATRAAQYIADQLHGKGNVAILSGTPGASPTIDRTNGFNEIMKHYPNIKIVANVNGNYDTNAGYTGIANLLTRLPKGRIDWIFSEADVMSLGAMKAIGAAGRGSDVRLSGIDGQNEGFQAIQAGTYAATVVYPLGAAGGGGRRSEGLLRGNAAPVDRPVLPAGHQGQRQPVPRHHVQLTSAHRR